MNTARPDQPARRLARAVRGLPAWRADWGRAMTAELAAIESPAERTTFARSAAGAAIRLGWAVRVSIVVGVALLSGLGVLVGSRLQLEADGPGLLAVSVPLPALLLLAGGLVAAQHERSALRGLAIGAIAAVTTAVVVLGMLAAEGLTWMSRLGVYALDREPPRGDVTPGDIALDVFTTGMWMGHAVLWVIGLGVGVLLGAFLSRGPEGALTAR